ncbi:GAF domain-containing protein [Pedobacter sp. MC2016-15]|uniref:GAF domain-containing protein n=1 Tax=Pedobacter sp. MC2016-15 TaxID=2994473 RepID=UPI002245E931|nr:GAF domain-containing protein [Pedobacter sp. MC2016-15]MCX2479533.1 GAF domain-containing protein [Pedobacter sp. MC2016-15]
MQAIILDLNKSICGAGEEAIGTDIQFSLRPFIDFLKEKRREEKTAKVNFYNYLLEQFSVYPELQFPVPTGDTAKYNHLYELIYTALSPIINDEEEQLWALGRPVSPCFYYGTNAFYAVLLGKDGALKHNIALPSKEVMEQSKLRNFYNLILRKFYDFTLGGHQDTIKSVVDQDTHLVRYYRMNIDNRFLEITANTDLPELSVERVKEYLDDESSSLDMLARLLPPSMFRFEGLSIVSLVDVTAEYALEAIKNTIIEHNQCLEGWNNSTIVTALKSLVGTPTIEFSLLPYMKLNQKTLLYSHEGFESIIIKQAKRNGLPESEYTFLADNFVAHPRRLVFTDMSKVDTEEFPLLRLLKDSGIQSYGLFPLYYNAKLVGCLELYSYESLAFNGSILSNIEAAFPLLAQLYQNIIVDFNNEINAIITDKFTALQPSVQWRFIQVAYQYMKSGGAEKNLPVDPVLFKDVHPFYGAIDIRNSSIERNLMIRRDLYAHFEVLEVTLEHLKTKIPQDFTEDFPKQKSVWDHRSFDEMSDREIMKTDDYLQRQLPSYFNMLKDQHPQASDLIDEYFNQTKPGSKIYENRDNYELSMQMINHALNRQLDEFNAELQELYPCYFEKFRTDGVEFDIYLGQSITPDQQFDRHYLTDFRYRQLKAIAEITQVTGNLTPHLPIPLETTQLIFVYDKLIDIGFRLDEQRFDVEGSYNIRYQMVKKRIDKAHLIESTERITQPGKIAIVYFNPAEAQEYLGYIHRLQDQNLLTSLVEYIDVEELQGVEGLKALRVEVAMNNRA